MGVINSFIKPIVSFLSLPISCLTFGLFAVVINAGLFALGAWLVPAVEGSWFGAVIGSIIASIAGGVTFPVRDEPPRHAGRDHDPGPVVRGAAHDWCQLRHTYLYGQPPDHPSRDLPALRAGRRGIDHSSRGCELAQRARGGCRACAADRGARQQRR